MNRFRSQRIAPNAGYTLLELLAVTAILMLLSLFSVPVFDYLSDKARLATSLEDLRVIEQALEAYRAERGYYPKKLGDLRPEYLKPTYTFESPWSSEEKKRYFFYAVDDKEYPRAYILGDPGPNPECSQAYAVTLSASNQVPLPCGTNPKSRARVFAGSEPDITLSPAPPSPPRSLSGFRQRCDPRTEQDMKVAPGCIVKTES